MAFSVSLIDVVIWRNGCFVDEICRITLASLKYNVVANFIGRIWAALLGILFVPVYIRMMGIEAYGLVGFYMVLSSLLGILDLGIGATMNRELARLSAKSGTAGEQCDVVRTLEVIYWGIAFLAGVVVVFLAPHIASFWIKSQDLDSASVVRAVRLMGVAVTLQFLSSLYQGGLMGLQRQVFVNAILVFTGSLRSAGVVVVLWFVSPTIESFLAWQIVSNVIGVGALIMGMWRSLPRHTESSMFRLNILHGLWKYAGAISANAIIGVVLTQLDKVILSKMLPLKMFGYYSLAATVASAVWMIIIPFNTAIFPRFVQLYETARSKELCPFFHRSAQTLSAMLLPVCALLIVFSREILLLWSHDPLVVENCHLIVSLLVFGTMLNGVASIPGYSASAFGWPQLVMYTNLIQALVIIPLIIGLVCWAQGVGAAIASIILNGTFVIFTAPIYFRRYYRDEQWVWYVYDVGIPAFIAFSVCGCMQYYSPAMHTPWAISGWLVLTGLIAFVSTGLALSHIRALLGSKQPIDL